MATMEAPDERLALLTRRFDLVQEFAALHLERTDVDAQLAYLRTVWSEVRAGTVGPLSYDELRTLARDLRAVSERLRVLALQAQGILLEQQMLYEHLRAITSH